MGINQQTIYNWRNKYGGMEVKGAVDALQTVEEKMEKIRIKQSTTTYKVVDTFCAAVGLVGVTGIEPATSCSQSMRATNCATPRCLGGILAGLGGKKNKNVDHVRPASYTDRPY